MQRTIKTSPYNFGAITKKFSNYEYSKVVIIPVRFDSTTTYRGGTRDGPEAVIRASRYLELYDEELGYETYRTVGINTYDEIQPLLSSPKDMVQLVERIVLQMIEDSKLPVLLGGEHTVSIGAVKAFSKRQVKLSVLQLDAHPDLFHTYEGTKYSHACTMRRIGEICPFVQIGIRSASKIESDFMKTNDVNSCSVNDFLRRENVVDDLLRKLEKNVYVTIDLDVYDPSEMPSVGAPEPGGLHWHDILSILRKVTQQKNVVGFDVVELSPIPGNIAPDFLAAKLIYKLLGYVFHGSPKSRYPRNKN